MLVDLSSFDLMLIIPILLVVILIVVFSRTLTLPEGYFKDRQIREAMMKRIAEKRDLERMEEIRARKEAEEAQGDFDE